MPKKLFSTLIGVAAVLFVLLWLLLHCFNRFATDDYQVMYERFHHGIIDGTINQYLTWCGRWMPLAFMFLLLSLAKMPGFLILYGVITVCFFILSSFRFFRVIATRFMPGQIKSRTVLAFAIFFILSFFLLTPEKGEVWFWFNSTTMYLWNLIFFLFGLSFLVEETSGKTEYLFIGFSFAYVGASSEPFAILTVGVLIAIILYERIYIKLFSAKYLWALLATLGALALNLIAEGNAVRESNLPPPSGRVAIRSMFNAVGYLLEQHWMVYIGVAVALFICWVAAGMLFSKDYKPFDKFNFKYVLVGLGLLGIMWVIILLPAAYTLGDIPPQRVQGPLHFTLAAWLGIVGMYLGLTVKANKGLAFAGVVATLAIIGYLGYLLVHQGKIGYTYSNAVDIRLDYIELEKEEGRENTLYLEPLPDPGYLYSAELSTDSAYFSNLHYKSGLRIPFYVAKKK